MFKRQERLDLAGKVMVTGADRHPHASRRLREAFPSIDWHSGEGAGPRLTLMESSRPEASYRITVERTAYGPHVTIEGGPFSGIIFGTEDLIGRGGSHPGRLVLPGETIDETPGLTYRTFWTWDHSTNWELSQIGQQEIGVFNPYGKPPNGFLADYKRCVDFCSQHRISAIVIYGFLRDSHGGVATAQELCHYAYERGVRILPGIAIGSYGGVYWEGDSPWNLANWLKQNPQHTATLEKGVGFQISDLAFPLNFPKSDYTLSACPSAPETIQWMEDAVAWLTETFEIGGINIEAGDYGVCGCERCSLRRDNPGEAARRRDTFGDYWSHTDMAENFPRLYNRARLIKPDLWIYSEIQWDNLLDPVAHEAQQKLPKGGIYQHTTNRTYWSRIRDELTRPYVEGLPMQPNVLRCQFACQWNGDERSERYALNARVFGEMAQLSANTGMQGLTIWGEPSPYHATVELSYRAFAEFSWSPKTNWEEFVAGTAADLLGGREAAESFIAIAEELNAHQIMDPERLKTLRRQAAGHRADNAAGRRWLSLEDQITRRIFMGA